MTMKSRKLLIIYRFLFLNIFVFQCSCEMSSYKDNAGISQELIIQTRQSDEQNRYPGTRLAPIHITLEQYNKVANAGGIIRMDNVPSVAKRVQLISLNGSEYATMLKDIYIENELPMFILNEYVYKLKVVLQTIDGPCAIKMAIEILGTGEYAKPEGGDTTPELWTYTCSTQKNCVLVLDWKNKCDESLRPRNDKLPIRLTKYQYNRIVHAKPRMMMHNVPKEVNRVKLSQHEDTITAVEYDKIQWSLNDIYVYIPTLDVTKGIKKLYATLITLNRTCATKLVIEIYTQEHEEKTVLPVASRTRSTDRWIEQCSIFSCNIDLDWKNECDVIEKPHDRDSTEGLHTAASPGRNIVVTDDPFNDDEPTLDVDKPLKVGETVTYICESKEIVNTTIQWIQRYNDDNTMIVALNSIAAPGRKYKLVLKLQDFDYNTNLQCIVHMNGKDKEVSKAVSGFNTSLNTITDSFPAILTYKNYSRKNYTCSEKNKPNLLVVTALVRGNKIRKFDTNYSLTKNDNGSILCCIEYLDNSRKSEIQRTVHKKYILIYQESTPKQIVSGLWVYYYVVAAVITILVCLLIAFAVVKRLRKKKVQMLLASQEADNHPPKANEVESKPNLYSNVTLYAELDLVSRPQNYRRPVVQDSTYAEIISPNTVLYAQLDLQDGKQNAQVEESPYAQIRH